jgi:hypothetical protein
MAAGSCDSGECAGLSHVVRYPVGSVLKSNLHLPPVFSSSFNQRPHGTSYRSRWWPCRPLCSTHSSRTWCQRSPPRQARVRLSPSLFPFLFLNVLPLPSASWVEIPPKLHLALTVLELRLSKTTASQTPQRFSSTIPRAQCVFSTLDFSYSAEVPVLYDVGS